MLNTKRFNLSILLSFYLFIILIFSCNKDGYKKVKDTDNVNISVLCFNYDTLDDNYIINEDSIYQKLLIHKQTFQSCSSYTMPEVDFANKTVLAKKVSMEACSANITRELWVNEDEKKYKYVLNAKESGDCNSTLIDMNWIAVPKISSDYEILFEVK